MQQTILVTGGCGYIGSHTVVELLLNNYKVIIVDNLSNSSIEVLARIKRITNGLEAIFYQVNINDELNLNNIFLKHKIDAVIHFAGFKAVGESVEKPLEYYHNNVSGSITLLNVMKIHNVTCLVFSSSATVYGEPNTVPISEDFPLSATNPYGWSKLMIEQVLCDLYKSNTQWSIALLRYFNPVGAHKSGLIGENPNGIPNNLMPYISQVAVGKLAELNVFGNDYFTSDGTGVRDYIHVVDLANGHIKALEYYFNNNIINQSGELITVNLGTGIGYSVLDMVKAFEKASGQTIPYKIKPRRSGDIATCYANTQLANELLHWSTKYDINDMCEDTWRWQSNNPNGYSN